MTPPTASRWIARSGWLLTAGTIVTAVSLVPIFVERPEAEWLGLLGLVGTMVAALVIRATSPSAFLIASIVGFLANVLFFAVLLGLIFRVFEQRRRRLAQP